MFANIELQVRIVETLAFHFELQVHIVNDTDLKFKMEGKCFGTAGITDVTITSSVNNIVPQLETHHQFHQIIALMSLRSVSLSLLLSKGLIVEARYEYILNSSA